MSRTSDTPIIPLTGQLAFRFMIEPGQPHASEQERSATATIEAEARGMARSGRG